MFDAHAIWTADAPLEELSFFRDWDYFASMLSSLRQGMDGGPLPLWEYAYCGGRPALANPQSFAFTWPGLFALFLGPNAAMLALWACLTALGVWAVARLAKEWTGDGTAAWFAGILYGINGYFATHFNQGHLTFAFFHLVPCLILARRHLHQRWRAGLPHRWAEAAFVVTTFLFFSSALPHGVFYFYGAFLIEWACAIACGARGGERKAELGTHARAAAYHALGVMLAAYKLLPIAAWQRDFPRRGVPWERNPFPDAFSGLWRWEDSFAPMYDTRFPGQAWGLWEYHAYIGPLAILLAVVGWLIAFPRKRAGSAAAGTGLWTALICALLGLNLSLGNAHPASLGQLFRFVPIMAGIRVPSRYLILTVFGAAMAGAFALAWAKNRWPRLGAPWVARAVAMAVLAAPTLQAIALAWNIDGRTFAELREHYRFTASQAAPRYIVQDPVAPRQGFTHQRFLIEHNYWVANCYEPLTVGAPSVPSLRMGLESDVTDVPLAGARFVDRYTLALDVSPAWWAKRATVNVAAFPFTLTWPPMGVNQAGVLEGEMPFGTRRIMVFNGLAHDDLGVLTSALGLVLWLASFLLTSRPRRTARGAPDRGAGRHMRDVA